MNIERKNNGMAYTLEIRKDGALLFVTLDDCFGKDRIKDWAEINKIDVTQITGF